MLEMHRRLSDIIFAVFLKSSGWILKETSLFQYPCSNIGEGEIAALPRNCGTCGARALFDFDCETTGQFVITPEASSLLK
jgi:hypothetical protein